MPLKPQVCQQCDSSSVGIALHDNELVVAGLKTPD
jgi:hypothetical protein